MDEQDKNKVYDTYQFTENDKPEQNIAVEKKKKEHGAIKFFRNILVVATLGLVFGICGGLGLQLIESTYVKDDVLAELPVVDENGNTEAADAIYDTDSEENEIAINTISNTIYSNVDIIEMVQNSMPAMVSIENYSSESVWYFGQTLEEESISSGSGFIVGENDTELLVVTNHHVISDATELKVFFIDGTSATALVKGSDEETDLAVIAIQLDDISDATKNEIAIVPMGDSDQLQLGEYVVAIGNALGYGQSVTDGIISALNRELEMENGYVGQYIQTNAEINFGNSGGALLNANGEVIGINSSKMDGDSVEGMGYAIPISLAKPILEELMLLETKIKVSDEERGYMGITYQMVDSQTASIYGWDAGLYIRSVEVDSAAERAGLEVGDIITKINGTSISTAEQLESVMQYCAAGDVIEVEIYHRDGNYTIQFILDSKSY